MPRPTLTAQPYPQDELLWNFIAGEGEQGYWCEDAFGKGSGWAQNLILQTAQEYSIPDNNATGQYSVEYTIQGHGQGFPDGET